MDITTPAGTMTVEAHPLPPTFALVLPMLRALGLARIVDEHCPMKNGDHLRHGTIVEFLVLHFLQSTEELPLYKMERWAEAHNVHLLFGCEASRFNDDRIRRTLDELATQLPSIEQALVARAVRKFRVPIDALDWDLTHIKLSGLYEGSEYVAAGYGDGQMHAKQVHVSLYTTNRYGIPVMHSTLPGNAQQAPYALEFLTQLQNRVGRKDLLILSDCAGITYETMADYEEQGAQFLGPLAITPSERELLNSVPMESFRPLDYTSYGAKECIHSCYDTGLTIRRDKHPTPITARALFTHTTDRHKADSQERRRKISKVTKRLQQISGYLNAGRYVRFDYAQEQISKAIPQELAHIISATLRGTDGQLHLEFQVDEQAIARDEQFDGRRVLVTNVSDATPSELYEAYKRHVAIESRFRIVKNEIRVNGIFLHSDQRITALIAVVVMALLVFTLMGLLAERAGLDTEHYHKMTTRELLFRFQDATLLAASCNGRLAAVELTLSAEQCHIIQQLGLPKPTIHIRIPGVQLPNWHAT